jgi:hypothetical protein
MAYSFIAALFIKHAAVATGVAMRAKYKTDNFAASAALTYLDVGQAPSLSKSGLVCLFP